MVIRYWLTGRGSWRALIWSWILLLAEEKSDEIGPKFEHLLHNLSDMVYRRLGFQVWSLSHFWKRTSTLR
jgi:hypothetical protein